MKILLTGASGQVGRELARSLQGLGELVAPARAQLDLADLDQLRAVVRAVQPALIINCAAYTGVDQAESEPQLAQRINAEAPAVMAAEARALGAAMIQYSTDYVFDGSAARPYVEGDATGPVNVYGRTKLAGEQAVAGAGIAHLILRTSWVYGMHGNNFLLTMLRLGQQRDEVRVVNDQHGAPTWSRTIAGRTAQMVALAQAGGRRWWDENSGLYHLSSQGQTTWCGFAEAIMQAARLSCRVVPVASAAYPQAARRPHYSVLDSHKFMLRFGMLPEWRAALAQCLASSAEGGCPE